MGTRSSLILASILALAQGTPAAGQNVQYLGNTSTTGTTAGGNGIMKFDQLCNAAFPGVNARVCTSAEIIRNAGALPASDTDQFNQWVAPTIVGTFSTGSLAVDFSGRTGTPDNLSCKGWSSSASTVTGLVFKNAGQFDVLACNAAREVTCCAVITTP